MLWCTSAPTDVNSGITVPNITGWRGNDGFRARKQRNYTEYEKKRGNFKERVLGEQAKQQVARTSTSRNGGV